MAVGIASGRFALQRANQIEHENAADQIYQGLQSYYSDMREYPDATTPDALITTVLAKYIDDFDGGSQATYYYDVDGTNQTVLVCVTLGGIADENQLGVYCTGNGVGSEGLMTVNVPEKMLEYSNTSGSPYAAFMTASSTLNSSNWDPDTEWGGGGAVTP